MSRHLLFSTHDFTVLLREIQVASTVSDGEGHQRGTVHAPCVRFVSWMNECTGLFKNSRVPYNQWQNIFGKLSFYDKILKEDIWNIMIAYYIVIVSRKIYPAPHNQWWIYFLMIKAKNCWKIGLLSKMFFLSTGIQKYSQHWLWGSGIMIDLDLWLDFLGKFSFCQRFMSLIVEGVAGC